MELCAPSPSFLRDPGPSVGCGHVLFFSSSSRCRSSCFVFLVSPSSSSSSSSSFPSSFLETATNIFLSFSIMKIHLPSFLRRKPHPSAASSSTHSSHSSALTSSSASSTLHIPLPLSFPVSSTYSSLPAQKPPLPDVMLAGVPLPGETGRVESEKTTACVVRDPNLELREAFQRFDVNGDGKISVVELGSILRSLGDEPSDEELSLMVNEVDRDGDGCIDLEEFILVNMAASSDMESEGLREAFRVFDMDADGKISAQELHSVLRRLGETCTVEECGRMIRGVDADGDGYVDFQEFCDMMALQLQ